MTKRQILERILEEHVPEEQRTMFRRLFEMAKEKMVYKGHTIKVEGAPQNWRLEIKEDCACKKPKVKLQRDNVEYKTMAEVVNFAKEEIKKWSPL